MSVTVLVQIDTQDRRLAFDLMDSTALSKGDRHELGGGASVTFQGIVGKKSAFGVQETIELAISFSSGVGSGLIANWLYGKLKGKATRVRIHRQEVELDRGKI